jgi:hypothetical protein
MSQMPAQQNIMNFSILPDLAINNLVSPQNMQMPKKTIMVRESQIKRPTAKPNSSIGVVLNSPVLSNFRTQ